MEPQEECQCEREDEDLLTDVKSLGDLKQRQEQYKHTTSVVISIVHLDIRKECISA